MKKILTIVGGGAALLLAVVFVGALVVSCQIESIIEEAIEQEGSEIVGTPLTVGSVELSILSGEGAINDLALANPAGFDAPSVLDIGKAAVHLDPWSVLDKEAPVDIHSVELRDAMVTVEVYVPGMKTNVGVLKQSIADFSADHPGDDNESGGGEPDGAGSAQRKLRIERLRLENTRVKVVFHGPRRRIERSVGISDFELQDLGGDEGAPPPEIAREVFMAVATKARAAMFRIPGPWQKLRNELLMNLDEDDLERLQKVKSKLLDVRDAFKAGKSLRDLRDIWIGGRGDGPDGGPTSDGGEEQPKMRDQIKALQESLKRAREARKAGPGLRGGSEKLR